MKGWKPGIDPARLEAADASDILSRVRRGESDVDGCAFADADFAGMDFYGMAFTRCSFTRCRFTGAKMGQCSFVDVVMESCDLSNTEIPESFWQRCILRGCRLVGARLDKARLRQVELSGCAAMYAGFDQAGFDRVRLENCDFQSADLRACKCRGLSLAGCRVLSVNLCQTALAGVDFTASDIGGWTLTEGAPELRGAVVTPLQAVELAERLGLIVKTRD